MSSSCSDADLLHALRGGDRNAGAELFARHAETSRALARYFGAGADTPDVVQDVWTQIFRQPPVLRNDTLVGWLATVIRNHVTQLRRQANRFETLSSGLLRVGSGTTPTQRVAQSELLRQVLQALESGYLSDADLQALTLRYSTTSAEAGRQLGVPASTFRSRVGRALRKLTAIVGQDE